jgi:F0F1-type ATP synthase membrane subunit b/b'
MDAILKTLDLTRLDLQMIAVCCLLFVVLWTLMERLVFRPYLAFLEKREASTSGAQGIAQDKSSKADELLTEYNRRLTDARVAAMKKKLDAIELAKKDAAGQIKSAEDRAKVATDRNRAELQSRAQDMRAAALKDADAMVEMVMSKVKAPASATGRLN